MLSFITVAVFIAFPERNDAILSLNRKDVKIETSGSNGKISNGKCVQTFGNETLYSDEETDWCSNIIDKNKKEEKPFIQYSIKNKRMKISKFSVRNGCCTSACCCINGESTENPIYCCELYSYSLQGSNDRRTWKILHKSEKDSHYRFCETKSFDLPKQTEFYRYVRFVLDEEIPNCPKCMQINQIELYGETHEIEFLEYEDNSEDDESISIIGRIK